jgi:hypothetical protein
VATIHAITGQLPPHMWLASSLYYDQSSRLFFLVRQSVFNDALHCMAARRGALNQSLMAFA